MVPPIKRGEACTVRVTFRCGGENEKTYSVAIHPRCTKWWDLRHHVALAAGENEEVPFRLVARDRFDLVSDISHLYSAVMHSENEIAEGRRIFYSDDDEAIFTKAELSEIKNDNTFYMLETKGLRARPLIQYKETIRYEEGGHIIRIAKGDFEYMEFDLPASLQVKDLHKMLGVTHIFAIDALDPETTLQTCTSKYFLLRTKPDLHDIAFSRDTSSASFKIYIQQALMNKTIQVYVRPGLLIRDLKLRIYHTLKVPPDLQRLVFSGKRLNDHNKIIHYDIQQDSTIVLALPSIRGGMFHPSSGRNDLDQVSYPLRLYTLDHQGNEILIKQNLTASSLEDLIHYAKCLYDQKIHDLRLPHESALDYAFRLKLKLRAPPPQLLNHKRRRISSSSARSNTNLFSFDDRQQQPSSPHVK